MMFPLLAEKWYMYSWIQLWAILHPRDVPRALPEFLPYPLFSNCFMFLPQKYILSNYIKSSVFAKYFSPEVVLGWNQILANKGTSRWKGSSSSVVKLLQNQPLHQPCRIWPTDLFDVPQDTPWNQLNATDPIIFSVEELVSEVRCSNLQPTLTFNHPPSKISANFPDFPCWGSACS